ncbi:FAD-dependent thymidylate synthase [Amphritea sp. HPY]|uniref:FAD-dependent thymidylate synthase n=1 Tax=Amphritea sp. HPY TaxID=3421652 RepID=UPI003D7CCB49
MNAEYIDHMGSDLSVVRAARVSFAADKGVEWTGKDAGLIKYLAEHNHWTPFAHTAITLRMNAPVPIRTQCFKHKFGFVENEESRRYIDCTPTFFVPEVFRGKPTGGAKQGSAGEMEDQEMWTAIFESQYRQNLAIYEQAVELGLCPEQARFLLPQGAEVNWYWTGSLSAFARFYNQRIDPHAQKEIQDLATEVSAIIEPLFPVAWKQLTTKEG